MNENDLSGECAYCYSMVANTSVVPPVDDNDAWGALAQEHAPDCEWILTRAHRWPAERPTMRLIEVDNENNAEEFWGNLDAADPALAALLRRSQGLVRVSDEQWQTIQATPGYRGGPEYAPFAVIDHGTCEV